MFDSLFKSSCCQTLSRQKRPSAFGNTLMEYSVGASIVAIIAASLLLAGGHINQWMAMLKQTMQQQVQTASNEEKEAKAYALALKPQTSIGAPIIREPVLTLKDQGYLPQGELGSKIQTLGANGTTTLLANQLEKMAEKLQAAGTIDQAQHDQLLKLASQGYKIAEIEALVEKALTESDGNTDKFFYSDYSYDGKTYTIRELYNSIGFNGTGIPDNIKDFSEVTASDPGIYIQDFLKTYTELQKSELMSHPEVQSIVNQSVMAISIIAETTQHELTNSYSDDQNISTEMLKKALSKEVSSQTEEYSKQICTAGNTCQTITNTAASDEELEEDD